MSAIPGRGLIGHRAHRGRRTGRDQGRPHRQHRPCVLAGTARNSEIQIADGFHLAALEEADYEPVMLFINHSCEPNVGFAGSTVLVAMRDIRTGEELTTDYALFDDHDETMECRCGTPSW